MESKFGLMHIMLVWRLPEFVFFATASAVAFFYFISKEFKTMEKSERDLIVKDLNTAVKHFDNIDSLLAKAKENQNVLESVEDSYGKAQADASVSRSVLVDRYKAKYGSTHKFPTTNGGYWALAIMPGIGGVISSLQFDTPTADPVFWVSLAALALGIFVPIISLKRCRSKENNYIYNRDKYADEQTDDYYKNANNKLLSAKAAYIRAESEYSEQLKSINIKIQSNKAEIDKIMARYSIPECHYYSKAIKYFSGCFEQGAVDTFKEAYNRYMDYVEAKERNNAKIAAEMAIHNFEMELKNRELQETIRHNNNMEAINQTKADNTKKLANELHEINRKLDN